jgi:Na+-translocating ferredoxin:NAD+ oxidoreductase RnfD subunit
MTNDTNLERANRLAGLRRFAIAISVLNILGHTVFGFEQSIAQPFVAVGAAYVMELLIELGDAWARKRKPHFIGGIGNLVDFLLSAHITGVAVAMLLYANERLWVVGFAAAAAIASKAMFRAPAGKTTRHFMNPSNFGIAITLLLFPWVGIAPPYHFTEHLGAAGSWILPGIIVLSGTFLNYKFTRKLPLIAAWLAGFALQAGIRSAIHGTPFVATLLPMTGMAFILFTFYMVSDPATTPVRLKGQVLFGMGMAAAYGLLVSVHVVFGLFFGLTLVCALRGLGLYAFAQMEARQRATEPAGPEPVPGIAMAREA